MKKKYETQILYLEFHNIVIEINFIQTITYHLYYSLTRIIFKALFKYLFVFNETETIFLLRTTKKQPTYKLVDVDFFQFKNMFIAFNKLLFSEFKALIDARRTPSLQKQLEYISGLYSDERYQQISAKQYTPYLLHLINRELDKTHIPTHSFNSLHDIYIELINKIETLWTIHPLDTLQTIELLDMSFLNDLEMPTTSMSDLDLVPMSHQSMQNDFKQSLTSFPLSANNSN
jgi:hypothetical protein